MAEDILGGQLSYKVAGPVCRTITMTIRTTELEAQHGGGCEMFLGDSRAVDVEDADAADGQLSRRRAELLEELAAVEKELAAK